MQHTSDNPLVKPLRIGINGFGRIGRCITKILSESADVEIAVVNDVVADIENLAYLYNYDSTYGRSNVKAFSRGSQLTIGTSLARVFSYQDIAEVPWAEEGVDVVVESSGHFENLSNCRKLLDNKDLKKILVTQSPDFPVDKTIIMGATDNSYNHDEDQLVACSICDANALIHLLLKIDQVLGLESGFVTTLHPWLSYQKLTDSPIPTNHNIHPETVNYSLGRATMDALIPKNTTAVKAIVRAAPQFSGKLHGFSYRVPTSIVASGLLVLRTLKKSTTGALKKILAQLSESSPYVDVHEQPLVSTDYTQDKHSVIIDNRWTEVVDGQMVRVCCWYDNEWGYSHRVADFVLQLASLERKNIPKAHQQIPNVQKQINETL